MASLVVLTSLLDCSFAATGNRDATALSTGRIGGAGSGDAMPFSEASAAAASSARKVRVRFRPDLDTDGVAACAVAARPMCTGGDGPGAALVCFVGLELKFPRRGGARPLRSS